MKEFTELEKQIAEHINPQFVWIYRDGFNELHLSSEKPKKVGKWFAPLADNEIFQLDGLFNQIMANDKEPTRIRDIANPPILDDIEKRYLWHIIKPFAEHVIAIRKQHVPNAGDYIQIEYRSDKEKSFLRLPIFETGTMYQGMELNRDYSPEELGLEENDG